MATSVAAREQHDEVIQLGAGEIFLDVYENDAPTGGERYLGDSVGATISITTERTTIQSGDGAVARDLIDRVRSVTRTMGFTVQDASIANWALFLIGTVAEKSIAPVNWADGAPGNTPAAVGGVVQDVPAGRWAPIQSDGYDVGKIILEKSSGEIAAGAVTKGSGGTAGSAAAAGTDYEFDERTGRIYNKLAAATSFKIAKGSTAGRKVARAQVTADATETICAIRYVEDEVEGVPGRNIYIRRTNLVPAGEAALKSRDTPQQFAFTATVLDPGGGEPAMTVDGVEL